MGASESKPGPKGPKGDKGDNGDIGDSLSKEYIESVLVSAQDTENYTRSTNILKELSGDAPNNTSQQKNNYLKLYIEIKSSALLEYIITLLRNNPLLSDSSLISQGNRWIQENTTVNIPLDKTEMVLSKMNNYFSINYNSSSDSEKRMLDSIGSSPSIYRNSNIAILNYIITYPNLTQVEINTYIKTYLMNVARDLESNREPIFRTQPIGQTQPIQITQPVQTTQAFTNYSTGIDYSKISVNNRPYSIKQKLTGSPISF